MVKAPDADFWAGRRVLLTGQTGFKGAWLTLWLERLGASVTAIGLAPERGPSLFELARVAESCDSRFADIRDPSKVSAEVARARPQLVLHLAAQALVGRSLTDPERTFATNVLGTVNLLNALREIDEVEAVLIVTSDKVYANNDAGHPMREEDSLGGRDPYSASKAACELAVHSFAASYFHQRRPALGTARAGNVIGGGDFAEDRVLPDCARAAAAKQTLILRQPSATRPWQHVLDCLCGYLLFAEHLVRAPASAPRALNFGPEPGETIRVGDLAREALLGMSGTADIEIREPAHSVEAVTLRLDSSLARRSIGWRNRFAQTEALKETATWYRHWLAGEDMRLITLRAIDGYHAKGP